MRVERLDSLANWRRKSFLLFPRGTSGEGWGEELHELKVTPLPGPLPIRSSWGEGEESCGEIGVCHTRQGAS